MTHLWSVDLQGSWQQLPNVIKHQMRKVNDAEPTKVLCGNPGLPSANLLQTARTRLDRCHCTRPQLQGYLAGIANP